MYAYTLNQYQEAARHIRTKTKYQPKIAIVLGSGLGELAQKLEYKDTIPYSEIPHFPVCTIPGHLGNLLFGKLNNVPVCLLQGRFHLYEGHTPQTTTFPIRVLKELGIQTLLLTNAAGGLNPDFRVGDLMLINDHINFPGMCGLNPLRGPNLNEHGPRFIAANDIYNQKLLATIKTLAQHQNLDLKEGTYACVSGPNYESAAEIRFLKNFADAVGMSTASEALVAHHASIKVLAISTITNVCISDATSNNTPSHEEVITASQEIMPKLTALIWELLPKIFT